MKDKEIERMNMILTTSSYIISVFLLLYGFVSKNFVFLTYGTLLFILNCIHFISVIGKKKTGAKE